MTALRGGDPRCHGWAAAPPSRSRSAGAQASLDATLACLRKGGEAVLVGLMGEARVDMFDIVNRELRLTTSVGYRDVYPTLIEWTARGLIDPSAIVTRTIALEAGGAARIRRADRGQAPDQGARLAGGGGRRGCGMTSTAAVAPNVHSVLTDSALGEG